MEDGVAGLPGIAAQKYALVHKSVLEAAIIQLHVTVVRSVLELLQKLDLVTQNV